MRGYLPSYSPESGVVSKIMKRPWSTAAAGHAGFRAFCAIAVANSLRVPAGVGPLADWSRQREHAARDMWQRQLFEGIQREIRLAHPAPELSLEKIDGAGRSHRGIPQLKADWRCADQSRNFVARFSRPAASASSRSVDRSIAAFQVAT